MIEKPKKHQNLIKNGQHFDRKAGKTVVLESATQIATTFWRKSASGGIRYQSQKSGNPARTNQYRTKEVFFVFAPDGQF